MRKLTTNAGKRFGVLLLTALTIGLAGAESRQPYQIQPFKAAQYEGLSQTRDSKPLALMPKEIYGTAPQIGIRIANGGAGYTGLIRALAEGYLATHPTINGKPFSIAWYPTNTTFSYYALRDHWVDLSLIYEIWPDALSGEHAYGKDLTLLFHDAFIFVGPTSNPAGLMPLTRTPKGKPSDDSIDAMLDKIIASGCKQPFASNCAMYASRSDLSGTYKKETAYMIAHRTPLDLIQNSPWYYPHMLTPREALQEASDKGMYTMNDKSTWLSQPLFQKNLTVYADGSDGIDANMDNPCYGLLAKDTYLQSDQPKRFLKWMAGPAGQKIIAHYGLERFGAPIVKSVKRH